MLALAREARRVPRSVLVASIRRTARRQLYCRKRRPKRIFQSQKAKTEELPYRPCGVGETPTAGRKTIYVARNVKAGKMAAAVLRCGWHRSILRLSRGQQPRDISIRGFDRFARNQPRSFCSRAPDRQFAGGPLQTA